ncbi:lysophospholipid acyltransferase family protein [Anaerococcus hydrogenalis]|uniref:1-acyl-sn-glycerol-3-phosphate acyltransferase n=1 Tax=Anaerococcus hydrogenalis TaxID=33029 RepID=A0A2N6ULC7_9FIRM|nr:lysophospholipid acyltransferase family protein [Anaerococcus hydrogenalis]MDK7694630.1 lysophospholipid acyltransferase family protein [Anaerococcus hydrogenalis]MDK7696408.1 lysophospholipid acyltransferase family protein [Anaerococcus hydrogenalis]MDK7707657.1 lysophospholipid acyltransferase family protein [Anaerococcus hydrogenalis]PMC82668.1 1-acyl-sn-glycerol-3-phosphate acyltransferase [Anaerococcus hydrogenalis]
MFYRFIYFLIRLIVTPIYRIKVHGIENIPKDQKYIICANHKSLLDPVFVALAVNRQVHFIAKKELFEIPILKSILKKLKALPAQRDGKDLSVLRDSIKLIKEGKILGIFPEGTRVKEIKRENIKDGAGYIALKSKTDILTIEIISSYKPFCKTDLYIKNPVKVENFKEYKSKDAMEKLMDETYEKMYENHKFLRKV